MYFVLLYCSHCYGRDIKGFWMEACEWQDRLYIGSNLNTCKKNRALFEYSWGLRLLYGCVAPGRRVWTGFIWVRTETIAGSWEESNEPSCTLAGWIEFLSNWPTISFSERTLLPIVITDTQTKRLHLLLTADIRCFTSQTDRERNVKRCMKDRINCVTPN